MPEQNGYKLQFQKLLKLRFSHVIIIGRYLWEIEAIKKLVGFIKKGLG